MKRRRWDEGEVADLTDLFNQAGGTPDWDELAKRLGTGRNGKTVQQKCTDLGLRDRAAAAPARVQLSAPVAAPVQGQVQTLIRAAPVQPDPEPVAHAPLAAAASQQPPTPAAVIPQVAAAAQPAAAAVVVKRSRSGRVSKAASRLEEEEEPPQWGGRGGKRQRRR